MHGAAHIQAAGHGDADVRRQGHAGEVIHQFVHDRLDHGGSVGGRRVAMDIALGVDDIGNAGAGTADGEFVAAANEFTAQQVLLQGLDLFKAGNHKFDIIAGGEADIAVAVFVGDVADLANVLRRHKPGAAAPDGEDFVPACGNMDHDARFQDVVIGPFAVVLLDNRRQEIPVMAGSNIGNPVCRGFLRVVFSQSLLR